MKAKKRKILQNDKILQKTPMKSGKNIIVGMRKA